MEVPNGGEGWQQLRQGHLPSEITNGKIHPCDLFKALANCSGILIKITCLTTSIHIRRPVC